MSLRYSTEEYQEMVRCYYLAGENASEAARVYAECVQSTGKRVPNSATIFKAVVKYRETGTFNPSREYVPKTHVTNMRRKIIKFAQSHPTENNSAIGRRFGIKRQTVKKWLNEERLFYKGESDNENDESESENVTFKPLREQVPGERNTADLRRRVIKFAKSHPTESISALGRRFGLCRHTVGKWLKAEKIFCKGGRPQIQRLSNNKTITVYPRIEKRNLSPEKEPEPKKKKKEKEIKEEKKEKEIKKEEKPEKDIKKEEKKEKLCCCCFEKVGERNLWSTEKKSGDNNVYGKLLQECFDITFGSKRDGHKICDTCKEQLKQAVQFKRQVLECKQRLIKSTYKIEEALCSDVSESGLPDLYDLTDDDMVDRNGALTDFDDDDEPLASLQKTEAKDNIALLKNDTEDPEPKTKKLKKKSKLKKTKKKEKTQDSELNKIEIEVEMKEVAETKDNKKRAIDPNIIDVDQEDDDVVFVKKDCAVPGIIELDQDDNNQEIVGEMEPVPEVAAIVPEMKEDNNQDENVVNIVLEPEPGPEVAAVGLLLEHDNANQDENVDVMETLPEQEPAPQPTPELEQELEPELEQELEPEPAPQLEPKSELELEPEPEIEVKAENIENDDDEDDPIRILNHIDAGVKHEPEGGVGDDGDIGDDGEVGDENAAIQEDEVIPEALLEDVPDPLNGINVIPDMYLEPKEEVDCVTSTIDDAQINKNTVDTDDTQPHMSTVQTSAVKNIDAIFNCTLREMLSRPSNILQDMNRRGHDMMQSFNERIPVPPAKPDPQLRTVRRPRRTNAEEVPRPNTSKECRVKKNVSNYLDLLR